MALDAVAGQPPWFDRAAASPAFKAASLIGSKRPLLSRHDEPRPNLKIPKPAQNSALDSRSGKVWSVTRMLRIVVVVQLASELEWSLLKFMPIASFGELISTSSIPVAAGAPSQRYRKLSRISVVITIE